MRSPRDPNPLFLILILILAAASILLLTGGAPAGETQADDPGAPDSVEKPVAVYRPTGADPAAQPAARLAAALATVREDFKRNLDALTARYHAAIGFEQRQAVQREISELKRGIDLRILAVQRDPARELGYEEEAAAIDARLEALAARGAPPTDSEPVGEGGDGHED